MRQRGVRRGIKDRYEEQIEMRRDIEKKRTKTERGSIYRHIILKLLRTKSKIYKVAQKYYIKWVYNIIYGKYLFK